MALYVDIEKRLGNFCLQVKFQAGNEILALLGASGCGKSMTLRCIAGIEKPDKGKIILDGMTLFDSEKKINLPPQKRYVGLLFQNYALFPHMTVEENILAGAGREKDKRARLHLVTSILERFGLTEYRSRLPHELSGGQQQRVALARILASQPRILLLDEPFSALDSHLRFQMEGELRKVIKEYGKAVVLVSHDRDEVYRMSRSIALMGHGTIDAVGTKEQIFTNPGTVNGARLTGCKNISRARLLKDGRIFAEDWGIALKTPTAPEWTDALGIRMHDIKVGSSENCFSCRVLEEVEQPFSYTLTVGPIDAALGKPIGVQVSKEFWNENRKEILDISIPPESILLLRDESRKET